jgi:hypothetical protein
MEKTRLEDLFVNNYRSPGVAEETSETRQTELVKLVKFEVRSIKALGMDLAVKV